MTLQPTRDGYGYHDLTDPGEPSTDRRRVSISDDEGDLLEYLAAGRRVFEIGTGLGVSTRALARRAKVVITTDIDPWVHDNIWPGLRGRNIVCLTGRPAEPPRVDLVFIDGDHHQDPIRADVRYAKSIVKFGGLIVVHDAIECAGTIGGLGGKWWTIPTQYGLALHIA